MKKIKHNKFPIVTVAAISDDFIIGDGNKLLWHLPNDLKRLKNITLGNPIIMGRKTYESIGRPLPGRKTIVISRSAQELPSPIKVCNDLSIALECAVQLKRPIFVVGGGQVYSQTIALADSLHLTQIHCYANGDIFFPEIPDYMTLKKQCYYESNINYTYEYYERAEKNEI